MTWRGGVSCRGARPPEVLPECAACLNRVCAGRSPLCSAFRVAAISAGGSGCYPEAVACVSRKLNESKVFPLLVVVVFRSLGACRLVKFLLPLNESEVSRLLVTAVFRSLVV